MRTSLEYLFLLLVVCVTFVLSAPAKKSVGPIHKQSSPSIQQQEKDLEKLANLAAQRLTHSMGMQKQKSFHYSNLNGDESSETNTEEKVLIPETGDIVSDIKEESKQHGGPSITKTKIEIPSEHIDTTFVETQPKASTVKLQKQDYSETFKFTPIEVAKYLYQTGNFEELDQALKDLVNASIMTEKQAIEYKENVKEAYEQLVQSTIYTRDNEIPLYNLPYETDSMAPADTMPAYSYYNELLPYGNSNPQNVVPADEEANGISDLVNTLMDEWLTRTVLTGDRDAETMLSAIWDNVSQDDNPDDLGQMRDILVDIFTSEIVDGLTSDDQQDLPYYSDLLTNYQYEKPEQEKSIKSKTESESRPKDDGKASEGADDKDNKDSEEDMKHLKM